MKEMKTKEKNDHRLLLKKLETQCHNDLNFYQVTELKEP